MANALAELKVNVPASNMDKFDEVAKGSDFLPRIQLYTRGRFIDTGKIAPGHYGVPQSGGEEVLDLGDSIDIVPFAFRAKAMDVSDRDAIVTVFDNTGDPEFKRIVAAGKDSGCFWGPTFLVYERSTKTFYELFFNNASGRTESGKMRPFLPQENDGVPKAATMTSRHRTKGNYSWHVPVINQCTLEFDTVPTVEDIDKAVKKFQEMKSGVERDSDEDKDEGASTKRAR